MVIPVQKCRAPDAEKFLLTRQVIHRPGEGCGKENTVFPDKALALL